MLGAVPGMRILAIIILLMFPALAQDSFLERDKDANGRLTLNESGLSPEIFESLDKSKNGELSLGEFGEHWIKISSPPFLKDANYGGHPRHKLDLYLPTERTSEMPLVLWIHGGSWKSGDKANCPFSSLTKNGVAVASLNYRYTPDAPFPAQKQDCEEALKWLKQQEELLGCRFKGVTAIGLSAGGHISLVLAQGGVVDRAVAFGSPSDLTPAAAQEGYTETLELLVGGPLEENQQALRQASPLYLEVAEGSRFYLAHGTADRRVPYQQSLALAKRLAGIGRYVDLTLIPDGSHTVVGGPLMFEKIRRAVSQP